MNRIKYLLVLGPCLLLVAPLFWIFARTPERPVGPDVWLLVVISALANVIVIAYHFAIPAHPKFLMRPWRRWVLRTHIFSGFLELVAGLLACFTANPTAALVMGAIGLFVHVPSAIFQVPIVFGSKAIMEPAYLLCIVTHAFCAGMLLTRPESHLWAVNTFLIFNVYVWCRLYFYVFDLLKLFTAMKYSIAILAAGVTILPAVFGAYGLLFGVAFIGAYILLYRAVFIRHAPEYDDFVREKARDSAIPAAVMRVWQEGGGAGAGNETDAAAWFRQLNPDAAGRLDRPALIRALAPWGLTAAATEQFADRLLAAGAVDLSRFKTEIWSIGAVRQYASHTLAVERAGSDRDKAELVFRYLDADGDGALSRTEIDLLLTEWGLPAAETTHYLARAAHDTEGRIVFSSFLVHLEPVWRYIFHEIFRANFARRGSEMIGRGVAVALESHRTGSLRAQIRRELLTRVPFLAGADEELIGNLAASLAVERFRTGEIVIAEGTPGEKFYLVAAGEVQVSKHGELINALGRGGSIGEGALLTAEPRAATVTAATETTLFSLTRAAFAYLTENYPQVRQHLLELHEQRRVANNSLALKSFLVGRTPLLRDAGNAELLLELAREFQPRRFRAGDVLLREGEPGHEFFLIAAGAIRLQRQTAVVGTIGVGGCLGEGALVSGEPRRATATAVEDTEVFCLSRTTFVRILGRYPTVQEKIMELHRQRLAADAARGSDTLGGEPPLAGEAALAGA